MAAYTPLQQQAYDYLKDKITRGELEYGKVYSERKMAGELGLSRTPFKEALVRLSQERYIDILPSRGFCLHVISRQDVINTYQSRTAIEGFCALLLHSDRGKPAAAAVLSDMANDIAGMEKAILDGRSHAEILSHDLAFHKKIVKYSGNYELIDLYESFYHQLFDIAMKTFEDPERPMTALKEHKEIYNNLLSDNDMAGIEVYRSIMKHMESTRDSVLKELFEE